MHSSEALEFITNSFIIAFEKGNENLIDKYFDPALVFYNHSIGKHFTLNQIKTSAKIANDKYQNLSSKIKDIFVKDNKISFNIEQKAIYTPEKKNVEMEIISTYTLFDKKVKLWSLWDYGYIR